MNNYVELGGKDFIISINDISADLFADNKYIAEVEYSVDLPFIKMINFSNFLESIVWKEDLDNMKFKISVSSEDIPEFQLGGYGLSWGVPATVLGDSFILELKLWCDVSDADIKNISQLQKITWVDIDDSLSGDEINAVWERKWCVNVEVVE